MEPKRPRTSLGLSPPKEEHQFREAAIAFAVDVSGSTEGSTLETEKKFVSRISNTLSPKSQLSSRILPWSGRAYPVLSLHEVNSLKPHSTTEPAVLITDGEHKKNLLNSSVWLLLTDGLIDSRQRKAFAEKVAEAGLHGTTCIAAIFGNRSQGPFFYDISVGISLYAAAPNCMFLFCENSTGIVTIFQAKGAFKKLLNGADNPVINESTKWESLPQLSIPDLAELVIPPAKRLEKHQMALQDSFVINLDDLWNNRLSDEDIETIFAKEDNLGSVIMTCQARDQVDLFQNWVNRQAMSIDDPLYVSRTDIHGSAKSTYVELMDSLAAMDVDQKVKSGLQEKLREAHAKNMKTFLLAVSKKELMAQRRNELVSTASCRSVTDINYTPTLSSRGSRSSYTNANAHRNGGEPFGHPMSSSGTDAVARLTAQSTPGRPPAGRYMQPEFNPRYYAPYAETWLSWRSEIRDEKLTSLLYTPGFRNRAGSFTGRCPICDGRDRTLAWLFRSISSPTPTQDFPPPGSNTTLAFPLVMGWFQETDILNPTVCCDPCSWCIVSVKKSPSQESIVGSLPMVRYSENPAAYDTSLQQGFGQRFAQGDLRLVFISVLVNAASNAEETKDGQLLRTAVQWTCNDLLDAATIPSNLSQSFDGPNNMSSMIPFRVAIKDYFQDVQEVGCIKSELMRYPLPGFAVLLQVAAMVNVPVETRRIIAFYRYLFALVEEYTNQSGDGATVKGLNAWTPSKNDGSARKELENLLIQEPGLRTTGSSKRTLSPVPVLSLRGSILLTEESYAVIQKTEDLKSLVSPDAAWVGIATAVFLHALNETAGHHIKDDYTPWALFLAVGKTAGISSVLLNPWNIELARAQTIVDGWETK
ncbi:hypothetical protein DL767_003511 [Monosporascus sp. MG133]|nr:hypothetical protein DL767_003511 [Monosporascus sp. MG133]